MDNNTNNQQNCDVICKKNYAAKSDRDLYRVCPSKLSKRELENLYFALLDNNLELKKTLHSQKDRLKVLSTKVQRMTVVQRNAAGKEKDCCNSKVLVNEQKDLIADLRKANEQMSERIRLLNMRLCSAKQFLRRSSSQTTKCTKCGICPISFNKSHFSSTTLNAKPSQASHRSGRMTSVSCQYIPDKTSESESTNPHRPTQTVETETDHEENEDKENQCNENKCRTVMEELKQKIVNLQEELTNTHIEYSSRISTLESDVRSLHDENKRVRAGRAASEHALDIKAKKADDLQGRLRETEGELNDLTMQLSIERRRVKELETALRLSNKSGDLSKIIEQLNASRTHNSKLEENEFTSPTTRNSKEEIKLSKLDDSGCVDLNKSSDTEELKVQAHLVERMNQEMMKRISELQIQLDGLRIKSAGESCKTEKRKSFDKVKNLDETQLAVRTITEDRSKVVLEIQDLGGKKNEYKSEKDINTSTPINMNVCEATTSKADPTTVPTSGNIRDNLDAEKSSNKIEEISGNKHIQNTSVVTRQVDEKSNVAETKPDNDNRYQIPGPIPTSYQINQNKKKTIKISKSSSKDKDDSKTLCDGKCVITTDTNNQIVDKYKTEESKGKNKDKTNESPVKNVDSEKEMSQKAKAVNPNDIIEAFKTKVEKDKKVSNEDDNMSVLSRICRDPISTNRERLDKGKSEVKEEFKVQGKNEGSLKESVELKEYIAMAGNKVDKQPTVSSSVPQEPIETEKIKCLNGSPEEMGAQVESPPSPLPQRQGDFNTLSSPVKQTETILPTSKHSESQLPGPLKQSAASQRDSGATTEIPQPARRDSATYTEKKQPDRRDSATHTTMPQPARRDSATYVAMPQPVRRDSATFTAMPQPVRRDSATYAALPQPVRRDSATYTAPGTYGVENRKWKNSRSTSPASTEREISSLSDLPPEKDIKSPPGARCGSQFASRKSVACKLAASSTDTDTQTGEYGALSDGEIPQPGQIRARKLSYGEQPSHNARLMSRVCSESQMEAALDAIGSELAQCRKLLAAAREQERASLASAVSTASDAAGSHKPERVHRLHAANNSPRLTDTVAHSAIFTLHIGTLVLSDEAVLKSREKSLCLTWQFYEHAIAMTRMRAGRVVLFDFSTEYDVLFNEHFLNYMKQEEMPITICDVNNQDEPFAICSLPLRDALIHANRRADMSLALVCGPMCSRARDVGGADTLVAGEELGVLDLWCSLRVPPTLRAAIDTHIARTETNREEGLRLWRTSSRVDCLSNDDDQEDRMSQEFLTEPRAWQGTRTGRRDSKICESARVMSRPSREWSLDRVGSQRNSRDLRDDRWKKLSLNARRQCIESERSETGSSLGKGLGTSQARRRSSGTIAQAVPANIRSRDEMKQALEDLPQAQSSLGSIKPASEKHLLQGALIPDSLQTMLKAERKMSIAAEVAKQTTARKGRVPFSHNSRDEEAVTTAGRKYDNIGKFIGLNKILETSKKTVTYNDVTPPPQTYHADKKTPTKQDSSEDSQQSIEITVLWLALNEECEAMVNPQVRRLYVAYSFLGRSGAELETPISLPKPKHYADKCYFNFKKTFHLHDADLPLLGHMSQCRAGRAAADPRDCIVFSVVSEPPEDPLGLSSCEDIGHAYLYLGDILAYSAGGAGYTEVVPVRGAGGTRAACGVLCVHVHGLHVLRRALSLSHS